MKSIKSKIKWKVSEPPSGQWRSFQERAWPECHYKNADKSPCAFILCEDEYIPEKVRTGDHRELTIKVRDHSCSQWRTLKRRAATLQEAKEILEYFLDKNPIFWPKDIKLD